MSEIFARLNLRTEHLRRLQDKKNVPAKAAWNLARRLYKHKNKDKTTFYSSVEPQAAPVLISQHPEDRMFVVDSRASMAHAEQERFKLK